MGNNAFMGVRADYRIFDEWILHVAPSAMCHGSNARTSLKKKAPAVPTRPVRIKTLRDRATLERQQVLAAHSPRVFLGLVDFNTMCMGSCVDLGRAFACILPSQSVHVNV